MAAANSNTATRHILQSGLYLTAEVAEQLSLRISDIVEYSPTKDAFIESIGAHNVATLEEISNLHLYDFGIFIELEPDEEEKMMLENNIQTALTNGNIELEDAVDIRMLKNIKLANQMLKIKRIRKGERDHKKQLEQTKAQGEAQAQAANATKQADIEKTKAALESQMRLEGIKTDGKSQILAQEASIKERLMAQEFQYNMQLKQAEVAGQQVKLETTENRKDDRTKMQATQQSELLDQKENKTPPKNFQELGGGLEDIANFGPR